jgi:hypothetical protein
VKSESDQMVEVLKKRGDQVEYMVRGNDGYDLRSLGKSIRVLRSDGEGIFRAPEGQCGAFLAFR